MLVHDEPQPQEATVERPNDPSDINHHAEIVNGHDLERQLELAEQRYAAAHAVLETARSELNELAYSKDVSPQRVKLARARLDAVAGRCRRLLSLIDKLEERLDL